MDDLMALALVLRASPLALLLPHGNQGDASSEFGNGEVRNDELWQWAIGERPLDDDDTRRFQAASLPAWLEVRSLTMSIGRGAVPIGEFDQWWNTKTGDSRGDS
ncbi:hypothetical protein [Arthrobacter sp. Leaf141]|uniref:hypothetical protein n=1 Tax=Arthrobacter sp. Leaf141 TaxID=1736273 RepID=UPI0012F9D5CC|nr:hypothetical protein [Arthrobacter sp. Leaf141]